MNVKKKLLCSIMSAVFITSLSTGLTFASPITIAEQGSFTVGGSYKQHAGKFSQDNFLSEEGQRAYGDFAYVEYQKPVKAKKLPLIFQHGGAQSKRTWESTPDMDVKVLIRCFLGQVILYIWLISHAVEKQTSQLRQ